MTGAIGLVILAIITAVLCFVVAWRWRGRMVWIDWTTFLAMGLGSAAIGIFYLAIITAGNDSNLISFVPFSRIIFVFILLMTALMAVFVLLSGGTDE